MLHQVTAETYPIIHANLAEEYAKYKKGTEELKTKLDAKRKAEVAEFKELFGAEPNSFERLYKDELVRLKKLFNTTVDDIAAYERKLPEYKQTVESYKQRKGVLGKILDDLFITKPPQEVIAARDAIKRKFIAPRQAILNTISEIFTLVHEGKLEDLQPEHRYWLQSFDSLRIRDFIPDMDSEIYLESLRDMGKIHSMLSRLTVGTILAAEDLRYITIPLNPNYKDPTNPTKPTE